MAVDDEAAQLAAAAALPLRERAKHKNWKARVAAFEDILGTSAAGGADDEAGPFSERSRDRGTRAGSRVERAQKRKGARESAEERRPAL